ncbi:MAG TPA: hypothetical protein VK900_09820 [Anaerolineales bacterium]|nr:hypothetical protein [Anaerolineales bacterium]
MKRSPSIEISLLLVVFSVVACSPSAVTTPRSEATIPQATATEMPPTLVPVTPTAEPAFEPGQWTYIFFHEGLGQVVLVNGGPEHGKPAEEPLELWGWDGAQWSLISADQDGPVWRNWPAVANDTDRDVLVIHGGLQSGEDFDETWEWDGQTWTRFEGSGPRAREGALMAYDPARENMILFGGSTPDFQIHGDTWMWDDGTWMQVSDTGPAARFPGGMVYDAARQEILMYSGHFAAATGEFTDYDDLWSWDGSLWREVTADGDTPGHRTHAGFVFDPVMEQVLLVGSGSDVFLGDIWVWDGSQWAEVSTANTPARSGGNVAYDPARDRFVLFGGVDRPGGKALVDTWEWDRSSWSCVHNC